MSVAEETLLLPKQGQEQYAPGQPFDHAVEHTDAYYEQYIAQFSPNTKRRLGYRFIKRAFDIAISLLLMILLMPAMVLIAAAIRLDSPGCVIFRQKRMGRNGKEFDCYKFRSMTVEAPQNCATSLLENPEQYQTRVGRFLRRTSLDAVSYTHLTLPTMAVV